jgi:hypothetical protein
MARVGLNELVLAALLVAMAGVAAFFAVPGEVSLALDLLLLSQWAERTDRSSEEYQARRDQSRSSLQLMIRRRIHLPVLAVRVLWVVADIPRVRALSASAVLASGALLGALASVFQVRGVSDVALDPVWLSVRLTTVAGGQGRARRELLGRLVERLGREGIAPASSTG